MEVTESFHNPLRFAVETSALAEDRLANDRIDMLFSSASKSTNAFGVFEAVQIIEDLHIHPLHSAVAKGLTQPLGSVGCNRAFADDNFVDSFAGNTNSFRKFALSDSERLHELVLEDLSGVDSYFNGAHKSAPVSMIINNLNIFDAEVGPAKYDAPLLIDANTMKADKLARECF